MDGPADVNLDGVGWINHSLHSGTPVVESRFAGDVGGITIVHHESHEWA